MEQQIHYFVYLCLKDVLYIGELLLDLRFILDAKAFIMTRSICQHFLLSLVT